MTHIRSSLVIHLYFEKNYYNRIWLLVIANIKLPFSETIVLAIIGEHIESFHARSRVATSTVYVRGALVQSDLHYPI